MEDIKNDFLPAGLILNLYKYYNPSPCYFKENIEFFDKSLVDMPKTYTTLGNFDRLSFSRVSDFASYREQSSQAYTWLGNRQSILMYPLETAGRRSFAFCGKQFGHVNPEGEFSGIQANYLLITLLYADGEAKASFKKYSQYLETCAGAVYSIADAYRRIPGKSVGCEVFGTFNSAELAIIWTADQFADILYLIDHLRSLTICFPQRSPVRAFISSHTFIALGRSVSAEECRQIKGGALIQMAGRTSAGIRELHRSGYEVVSSYVQETVKKAEEELPSPTAVPSVMYCAGEYDIILQTDPLILSGLFRQPSNGEKISNFYINNSEFNDHILESTTRLYYRQEDVDELREAMDEEWVKPGPAGLLNVTPPKDAWCGDSLSSSASSKYKTSSIDSSRPINVVRKICGNSAEDAPGVQALFQRLRDQVDKLLPATSGFLSTIDLAYSDYIQCSTTTVDNLWVKDFDAQFQTALNILIDCMNPADGTGESMLPRDYLNHVQEILHTLQQQCYHVVDSGKFFFEEPRSHFSYTGQYDLLMHAYYGILKCLLELLYQPPRAQSTLYPLINFGSMPAMSSVLYYENVGDTPEKSPKRLLVICIPYDAWTSLDHYIPMLIHEIYHYATPMNRKHRNYLFGCILMTWLHTSILEQWLSILASEKHYHRPVTDAIRLIVVEAQRFLAQEIAQLMEHFEDDSPTGSFKTRYINKMVGFLETLCAGNRDVLHRLAATLRSALEGLPAQEKWARVCGTVGTAAEKEARSVLDRLLAALEATEGGTVAPEEMENYAGLLRAGMAEQWAPLLETLNELFPDVAMVRIAGLDTAGYLLQFAIDQDNKLVEPQDLAFQTCYRLGCIIDWTTGCLQQGDFSSHDAANRCVAKLEEVRDQFYTRYDRVCSHSTVSAQAWFDFFILAYRYYLSQFPPYYPWLKELIFDEYLPCLAAQGETVASLTEHCKRYYTILDCEDKQKRENELFWHTIQLVQEFQQQKDLSTIDAEKSTLVEPASSTAFKPFKPVCAQPKEEKKWQFTLKNYGELHAQLDAMTTRLKKSHRDTFGKADKCKLWFRGCRNATFDILPSIMVHFADGIDAENFNGTNQMGTLLEYQWRLLEEYKFRADGAPEQLNSNQYHRLDYLALMQHYSQYTGLLDWSEDAYSSLYFAFEKFVDNADMKIEDDKAEDASAALYIMDPRLYNRARVLMIKEKISGLPPEYQLTIDGPLGYIPNLSIPENVQRFEMFVPGKRPCPSAKFVHETGRTPKKTELIHVEEELKNLPLAIYAPRMNPRLRAQSGIFMTYNLRALPIQPIEGTTGPIAFGELFHYLSLESIQRFYLEKFDEDPFMLKLSMDKNQKQEMGRLLRSLGLSRYRVYPELEHLTQK